MHSAIALALILVLCGWLPAFGESSITRGLREAFFTGERARTSQARDSADFRAFQPHPTSLGALAQASQASGTPKEDDGPPIRIKRGQKKGTSPAKPHGQVQSGQPGNAGVKVKRSHRHSHGEVRGHAHTHNDGHRDEDGDGHDHHHGSGHHGHADHAPGGLDHGGHDHGDHKHGDNGHGHHHDHHHGIYDRQWDVVSSG